MLKNQKIFGITKMLCIFHDFAVARYLEDKYCLKGVLEKKWIDLLDYYREYREQDQYSTSFIISKEEAENALNFSCEFLKRIKELLKNNHNKI